MASSPSFSTVSDSLVLDQALVDACEDWLLHSLPPIQGQLSDLNALLPNSIDRSCAAASVDCAVFYRVCLQLAAKDSSNDSTKLQRPPTEDGEDAEECELDAAFRRCIASMLVGNIAAFRLCTTTSFDAAGSDSGTPSREPLEETSSAEEKSSPGPCSHSCIDLTCGALEGISDSH